MNDIRVTIGDEVASARGARAGELLEQLVRDRVASRIFAHDATLWGLAAEAEASIRLGWTDFAGAAAELIPEIHDVAARFAAQGVDRIVLCGMGGSSLAPAVISRWAGVPFIMLDSTHPDAVSRTLAGPLDRTAVVVSSKSGSTIETRSHLATFEQAFRAAGIAPESRIVIVTDPGSPLDADSRAAGRTVFNADPNVGGRFSALTAFGLVPMGLAGADLERLVSDAEAVRVTLAEDLPGNPALRLATVIAAGLPERFVLTVREQPEASWGLGSWIEQLVAESTGKEGKGVLPIALQTAAPEFTSLPENSLLVTIGSDAETAIDSSVEGVTVVGSLGAQMLLWEVATAALGRLMGIDPFNQPDVEAAKIAARAALAEGAAAGDEASPEQRSPADLAAQIRAAVPAGGYLAIHAYVDPAGPHAAELNTLRDRLASALGVPVALGFGPSFLHSVGQLHKGGPALGAFLQVTDQPTADLAIADSESTFGELISAQARGDREVLEDRGRPVVRIALAGADDRTLTELAAAL